MRSWGVIVLLSFFIYGFSFFGNDAAAQRGISAQAPTALSGQPLSPASCDGHVDYIEKNHDPEDVTHIKNKANIRVAGWAVDQNNTAGPTNITVVLQGPDQATQNYYMESEIQKRPDVAQAKKNEALAATGYDVTFSAQDLKPGEYRLFIVVSEKGKAGLCDFKKKVVLP